MNASRVFEGLSKTILVMSISALAVVAQHARVETAKHSTAIPKVCESVVPASLDPVDIPALVTEAYCKGSGDMRGEYTYVTHSISRVKDKKGKEKVETFTYDVFFPILKSGMHTKGILVVTSHNGVPVPPNELEKERLHAAERLEKEEEKIARTAPAPAEAVATITGMLPLGSYAQANHNHESFGRKSSARLAVHTFLKSSALTLVRREQIDGRETLVFTFTPRPEAQFADSEKYIAQLTGEIWIDAKDRIVVRLVGWPASLPATANASKDINNAVPVSTTGVRPPAVYFEMIRLNAGIWLPRVNRINGADYPTLFDGITTDSNSTYSDFIHFSTEIKDVQTTPPNNP